MEKLTEGIKKTLKVGIGAATVAAEKVGEVAEELAQKGGQTVQAGKVHAEAIVRDLKEQFKPVEPALTVDQVLNALGSFTPEERAAIAIELEALERAEGLSR